MPLFSVVIPTYNRRERLLRALRSVLGQRFSDYEVVVVDDGSTDGTADAVAGFEAPVRLVTQQNRGAAAARNTGVRCASGVYAAFLDSDDAWLPWTLERYAALVIDGAPTWVYGRRSADLGQPIGEEPPAAATFPDYLAAAAQDGLLPLPSGVAVRRDAFLEAGGFDESLPIAEDLDLWYRLGTRDGFVRMDAPVAYLREHHEGNISADLVLAARSLGELVRRERRHVYPGPAPVRRAMLASELMGYAWQCREKGKVTLAARLYVLILEMQLRSRFREPAFGSRRNRYLLTFPLQLLSPRLHDGMARLAGRRS